MASIKRVGADNLGVPIWEAVYRRSPGTKQIRKRFHMESKGEVERAVALDCQKSGIGLKWSEGLKTYLDAKRLEGCGDRSLENVERAVKIFISLQGDLPIEDTTPTIMKDFMQRVVVQPVKHYKSGKVIRQSGPKVANHHRKELLTIARYLHSYTNLIMTVPFGHVKPLPTREENRTPVPKSKVNDYLNALPGHVRRPVMMVLYYGLRSTATCNLTLSSIEGRELCAVDKNDVRRRIPIDEMLEGIIAEAIAYRDDLLARPKPRVLPDKLFVNAHGRGWDRTSLLKAAQKAWDGAGLPKKKIHEIRHTLGTLAGKKFTKGMVQAAMGHTSEKSSERYFHPDEDMAAEVRKGIITELSQSVTEHPVFGGFDPRRPVSKNNHISCPFLASIFNNTKEKGRKP